MCPATRIPSLRRNPDYGPGSDGTHVILILSSDVVAAALLGALIETLEYKVRFHHPPEIADDALRREKPTVAMFDCEDPTVMTHEALGHARMRGSSVVVFGTAAALQRLQHLVREHALESLIMPTSLSALEETLRKAVAD